jgi:hypothetical protein
MADVNDLLSEAAEDRLPNPERLINWLLRTRGGRLALLEAMLSNVGHELLAERSGYETIHVLVKVTGDGFVEVMCEDRRVRAEIIELPDSMRGQLNEELDELTNLLASPQGRVANYWPTNRRAARQCDLLSVKEWAEKEEWNEFSLAVIRGLEELSRDQRRTDAEGC